VYDWPLALSNHLASLIHPRYPFDQSTMLVCDNLH
jgi:hypothetical protein